MVGGVWIGEETRDFNEVAQRKLGWSIIKAGDVDGDGIDEWAVGCPFHNDVSSSMGAIMILFMRDDGSVRETSLIKSVRTRVDSQYGYALALLGDINEDGIPDLMVGVPSPESGTSHSIGFVYTSTLSHDGQLYTSTFIDYEQLFISVDTEFGSALAVGDIDGDGVVDLFIGEPNIGSGKIHLVYMHANGTVDRSRNSVTLALGQSSASRFGSSVCIAGDLQNLGLFTDVYMGSPGDNVVYHRTFNRDGTVVRSNTILPQSISASDEFGASIATIGDLNGEYMSIRVYFCLYSCGGGFFFIIRCRRWRGRLGCWCSRRCERARLHLHFAAVPEWNGQEWASHRGDTEQWTGFGCDWIASLWTGSDGN